MIWACPICAAAWGPERDRVEEIRIPAGVPPSLPKNKRGWYTRRSRWVEVRCTNGHEFKASGGRIDLNNGRRIYDSVWTNGVVA